MQQNQTFTKISDELFDCKIEGNHFIVLLAICQHFSYWKENRVNSISVIELAEICKKSPHAVYQSLRYLRENHFLIKNGRNEYINPLVCYRCSESVRKDILSMISESLPKDNRQTFDFRNAKSATELDEKLYQVQSSGSTKVQISAAGWAAGWEDLEESGEPMKNHYEDWELIHTPSW